MCQSITDLAIEDTVSVNADDFRTLNGCLDNAIADSVTEYVNMREQMATDRATDATRESLGVFAHELRNLLATARLALSAIRTGQVGLSGSTAAVLDRSLLSLCTLVDRTLQDVRLKGPITAREKLIYLADFIAHIESPENLFQPFTQESQDRSGVGLGLSICRRSVEANHGVLRVRDVPGNGCVFTIQLARH